MQFDPEVFAQQSPQISSLPLKDREGGSESFNTNSILSSSSSRRHPSLDQEDQGTSSSVGLALIRGSSIKIQHSEESKQSSSKRKKRKKSVTIDTLVEGGGAIIAAPSEREMFAASPTASSPRAGRSFLGHGSSSPISPRANLMNSRSSSGRKLSNGSVGLGKGKVGLRKRKGSIPANAGVAANSMAWKAKDLDTHFGKITPRYHHLVKQRTKKNKTKAEALLELNLQTLVIRAAGVVASGSGLEHPEHDTADDEEGLVPQEEKQLGKAEFLLRRESPERVIRHSSPARATATTSSTPRVPRPPSPHRGRENSQGETFSQKRKVQGSIKSGELERTDFSLRKRIVENNLNTLMAKEHDRDELRKLMVDKNLLQSVAPQNPMPPEQKMRLKAKEASKKRLLFDGVSGEADFNEREEDHHQSTGIQSRHTTNIGTRRATLREGTAIHSSSSTSQQQLTMVAGGEHEELQRILGVTVGGQTGYKGKEWSTHEAATVVSQKNEQQRRREFIEQKKREERSGEAPAGKREGMVLVGSPSKGYTYVSVEVPKLTSASGIYLPAIAGLRGPAAAAGTAQSARAAPTVTSSASVDDDQQKPKTARRFLAVELRSVASYAIQQQGDDEGDPLVQEAKRKQQKSPPVSPLTGDRAIESSSGARVFLDRNSAAVVNGEENRTNNTSAEHPSPLSRVESSFRSPNLRGRGLSRSGLRDALQFQRNKEHTAMDALQLPPINRGNNTTAGTVVTTSDAGTAGRGQQHFPPSGAGADARGDLSSAGSAETGVGRRGAQGFNGAGYVGRQLAAKGLELANRSLNAISISENRRMLRRNEAMKHQEMLNYRQRVIDGITVRPRDLEEVRKEQLLQKKEEEARKRVEAGLTSRDPYGRFGEEILQLTKIENSRILDGSSGGKDGVFSPMKGVVDPNGPNFDPNEIPSSSDDGDDDLTFHDA